MFNQTWKKYLPVISILLKRAAISDQFLKLDPADFERAAGGRKMKFSFSDLQLKNGRSQITSKHSPMAKELALMMQADEQISKQLPEKEFQISLTTDFQLTIKNTTAPAEMPTGADINEMTD